MPDPRLRPKKCPYGPHPIIRAKLKDRLGQHRKLTTTAHAATSTDPTKQHPMPTPKQQPKPDTTDGAEADARATEQRDDGTAETEEKKHESSKTKKRRKRRTTYRRQLLRRKRKRATQEGKTQRRTLNKPTGGGQDNKPRNPRRQA